MYVMLDNVFSHFLPGCTDDKKQKGAQERESKGGEKQEVWEVAREGESGRTLSFVLRKRDKEHRDAIRGEHEDAGKTPIMQKEGGRVTDKA